MKYRVFKIPEDEKYDVQRKCHDKLTKELMMKKYPILSSCLQSLKSYAKETKDYLKRQIAFDRADALFPSASQGKIFLGCGKENCPIGCRNKEVDLPIRKAITMWDECHFILPDKKQFMQEQLKQWAAHVGVKNYEFAELSTPHFDHETGLHDGYTHSIALISEKG